MSACCSTSENTDSDLVQGIALQGDIDNATCEADPCTLTSCDEASQECASKPGASYKPSILIGLPEAEALNQEDGGGATTYFTSPGGIVWPAVGAGATLQVEDSSIFSAGQWIYVLGYGHLEIQDVPSAISIYAINRGTRGNVDPGTVVPANNQFTIAGKPTEEIPDSELSAKIATEVANQVPAAVAAADDGIPSFPNENVGELSKGRIPLWQFSDDESERRLGYQSFDQVTEGPMVVQNPDSCGGDADDVKFGPLKPGSGLQTGEMVILNDGGATDASGVPNATVAAPVDLENQDDVVSTMKLWAYELQQVTETYFRKKWRAIKKLVFPSSFIDSTTLADDEQAYRVMVSQTKDSKSKLVNLAPVNGKALVGKDGKWQLLTLGNSFQPELASLEASESTDLKAAGADWVNKQLALVNVPEGATQVAISARIIYTLEADVGDNNNTHNPAAALQLGPTKCCNAYSCGEDTGGSAFTGNDTGFLIVPFNTTTNTVALRIWKEGSTPGELSNRVTWEINQLGFYGPPV